MDAIADEAGKYKTDVQAYGCPELAMQGLLHVNASEILGFAYIGDRMPRNLKAMAVFMQLCDSLGLDKKFLIILPSDYTPTKIVNYDKIKNLRVFQKTFDTLVTDVVINRELFGSILVDNFSPYELVEERTTQVNLGTPKSMKYTPFLSKSVLMAMEPVKKLDTLEETLHADIPLHKLLHADDIMYRIRYYTICNLYGSPAHGDLPTILKTVDEIENPEQYCVCRSLLERAGVTC